MYFFLVRCHQHSDLWLRNFFGTLLQLFALKSIKLNIYLYYKEEIVALAFLAQRFEMNIVYNSNFNFLL